MSSTTSSQRRELSPASSVGNFVRTINAFRKDKAHSTQSSYQPQVPHTVSAAAADVSRRTDLVGDVLPIKALLVGAASVRLTSGGKGEEKGGAGKQTTKRRHPHVRRGHTSANVVVGREDEDILQLVSAHQQGIVDILEEVEEEEEKAQWKEEAVSSLGGGGSELHCSSSRAIHADKKKIVEAACEESVEPFWRSSRSFMGPRAQYARDELRSRGLQHVKTRTNNDALVGGAPRVVNVHSVNEARTFDEMLEVLRNTDATKAFIQNGSLGTGRSSSLATHTGNGGDGDNAYEKNKADKDSLVSTKMNTTTTATAAIIDPFASDPFASLAKHFYSRMFPPVQAASRDEAYCLARALDEMMWSMPRARRLFVDREGQQDGSGRHGRGRLAFFENSSDVLQERTGAKNNNTPPKEEAARQNEQPSHQFFQLDVVRNRKSMNGKGGGGGGGSPSPRGFKGKQCDAAGPSRLEGAEAPVVSNDPSQEHRREEEDGADEETEAQCADSPEEADETSQPSYTHRTLMSTPTTSVKAKPLQYSVTFVPAPSSEDDRGNRKPSDDTIRRTILGDPEFLAAQQEVIVVLMLGWMEGIRQVYGLSNEKAILLEKMRACFSDILSNTLDAARIYKTELESINQLGLDRAIVKLQHELSEKQIALDAAMIDVDLKQELLDAKDAEAVVLRERVEHLREQVAHYEAKEEVRGQIMKQEAADAERIAAAKRRAITAATDGGSSSAAAIRGIGGYSSSYTAAQIERFRSRRRRFRVNLTGKIAVGDLSELDTAMKMAESEHKELVRDRRLRAELHHARRKSVRRPTGTLIEPHISGRDRSDSILSALLEHSPAALEDDSEELETDEVVAVRDAHVQVNAADEEGGAEALLREVQKFLSEMESLVSTTDKICHQIYGTADIHDPSPMLRPAVRRLEMLTEHLYGFNSRAQHEVDLAEARLEATVAGRGSLEIQTASTSTADASVSATRDGVGVRVGVGSESGGAGSILTNLLFAEANNTRARGFYVVPQWTHTEIMLSANRSLMEITKRMKALHTNANFKQGLELRPPRHGQELCPLCKRVDPDPSLLHAFNKFEALRNELRSTSITADKLSRELTLTNKALETERSLSMSRQDELEVIKHQFMLLESVLPPIPSPSPSLTTNSLPPNSSSGANEDTYTDNLIKKEGLIDAVGNKSATSLPSVLSPSTSLAMPSPFAQTSPPFEGEGGKTTKKDATCVLPLAQRFQIRVEAFVSTKQNLKEQEAQTDEFWLSSPSEGARGGGGGGAISLFRTSSSSARPRSTSTRGATSFVGIGGDSLGHSSGDGGGRRGSSFRSRRRGKNDESGSGGGGSIFLGSSDNESFLPSSDTRLTSRNRSVTSAEGGGAPSLSQSSARRGTAGPTTAAIVPRPPLSSSATPMKKSSGQTIGQNGSGGGGISTSSAAEGAATPSSSNADGQIGGQTKHTKNASVPSHQSRRARIHLERGAAHKKGEVTAANDAASSNNGSVGDVASSAAMMIRRAATAHGALNNSAAADEPTSLSFEERIHSLKSDAIAAAVARFGYSGPRTLDGAPRAPASVIKLIGVLLRTKYASDIASLNLYGDLCVEKEENCERDVSFTGNSNSRDGGSTGGSIPFPLKPFPEHVVQQLQRMFGARRLIQQHTKNVLGAIEQYGSIDDRVKLFGIFVTEAAPLEVCHWVLRVSNALDAIGTRYDPKFRSVVGGLGGDEDRRPCAVPLDMVLHACSLVFLSPHAEDGELAPHQSHSGSGGAANPSSRPRHGQSLAAPMHSSLSSVVGGVSNARYTFGNSHTSSLMLAGRMREHALEIMRIATRLAIHSGAVGAGDDNQSNTNNNKGGPNLTTSSSASFPSLVSAPTVASYAGAGSGRFVRRTHLVWNHGGAIEPVVSIYGQGVLEGSCFIAAPPHSHHQHHNNNHHAQSSSSSLSLGLPAESPWCYEVPRATFLCELADYLREHLFALPDDHVSSDDDDDDDNDKMEGLDENGKRAVKIKDGDNQEKNKLRNGNNSNLVDSAVRDEPNAHGRENDEKVGAADGAVVTPRRNASDHDHNPELHYRHQNSLFAPDPLGSSILHSSSSASSPHSQSHSQRLQRLSFAEVVRLTKFANRFLRRDSSITALGGGGGPNVND